MTEYVNAVIRLDQVVHSPAYGSVIPLKDRRLMWVFGSCRAKPIEPLYAIYSSDEGATWSEKQPLKLTTGEPLLGVMETNLIRLRSGALGLLETCAARAGEFDADQYQAIAFHKSEDEGETWSPPRLIHPAEEATFYSNECSMVLRDGRIIVPVYGDIGPKPLVANFKRMRKLGEEFGNPGRCTLYYSYVYYSDDEGETWTRSRNETMVMLERGFAGSYAMGEPQVVELNDGRLLMFGRTNIGRIFKSYSPDRGHTWLEAEPTDLALTPSPSPLRRLPKTGDLLVIWNQTSRWENMIGLYRHRLSCAISKDEGETWQHHKNLESLDDTTRVEVDGFETLVSGGYRQPLDRVRYHRAPAPLRFNQPTCCFLDDKVIITYGMCVWGDKPVITETYRMDYDELMRKAGLAPYDRGNKVRVLSTDWFYG